MENTNPPTEEKQEVTNPENPMPKVRQRGKDGKFLPDNADNADIPTSKTRKYKRTAKKKENTVELKLNEQQKKEEKPARSFEGVLGNIKERLATNFIQSIVKNKPDSIKINGITYFSPEKLNDISDMAKENIDSLWQRMDEVTKIINENEEQLEDAIDDREYFAEKARKWRRIAIVALSILIASYIGGASIVYALAARSMLSTPRSMHTATAIEVQK